jgi:hypothetical protein
VGVGLGDGVVVGDGSGDGDSVNARTLPSLPVASCPSGAAGLFKASRAQA